MELSYLVENKVEKLAVDTGAINALAKNISDKWDWKLTPDIKEKFLKRFSKIKKIGDHFEAWDNNKSRWVLLKPDLKSFVQVKDTGNQCGFLRGAIQASKNRAGK